MGILYVGVAPAGDPDAISLRTLRLLQEVAIVVAQDAPRAQRLLAHHALVTPLVGLGEAKDSLTALETSDILLLLDGWRSSPTGSSQDLIQLAIQRGYGVAPIPGPSLPMTALVLSGLPADSFVYLGELPGETTAQQALLAAVADEHRTLVATARTLPLSSLMDTLGQRPLALATTSEKGIEIGRWRTLADAVDSLQDLPPEGPYVLVIGGKAWRAARWEEELLRAEVQARLGERLTAREIGRELSSESGWPRREIYRMAVDMQGSSQAATHNGQEEIGSDA